MTSRIKINCIKDGQKIALKSLISDSYSLYKIIDNIQTIGSGSCGFSYNNVKYYVTFSPENINIWIAEKNNLWVTTKTKHYEIIANGEIVDKS